MLLWNDVKGWINTVELNQSITQLKDLKPLYELLDEEQRHKIQQTYENIIIRDNRICNDYYLKLERYKPELMNRQSATSLAVSVSVCRRAKRGGHY